ncbi:MAG TPA: oxygenase MpaB family protein [Pseudonocardiaceae bacterium]|nr:oxygenase MpaB family protein [Pseudonocardiaceae bacterium]
MTVDDRVRTGFLGPDSLSWRYAGDWRSLLIGSWVGLVQLSLPALGAGVVDHSAFYSEPWDRFLRSVPQIAGVVYDGPSSGAEGRRIRRLHAGIGGVDEQGRRYHALDPDVFFWGHATISEVVVKMTDLFDTPLTAERKQRLYAESCQVWRHYGMSTRPVPADRVAFEAYLAHGYRHRLARTPAVTEFIRMSQRPGAMAQPWLPNWLWRSLAPTVAEPMWLVGVGLLDPAAREALGLDWTAAQERRLRRFAAAVRHGWRVVPRRLRYMPRAVAGFRRAGWPTG